ncbi:glycosyltransferase family 2 protein [Flavobacterium psychraquaticum]|uniref:glycosyltransferase family 2 protein n=1 Tax=Flavobacterium psychraquaticum TaxID=3103958 RepID=UPI002ACDAC35|nr:glycosyltransferase [Flavobacterium sp. LB-N7T]
MSQKPRVSVVMITYGHENYIRQAIEGVLMQNCDFDVELIVANDCSPDTTDCVINDIIQKHPQGNWIIYHKHPKNLGMMPNFIFALQQAQGEYIALCEGDDYWTDPYKLQKQVDFLEAHKEYVLCFHKIKILQPNGEFVDDFITKVPENYENQETLARLGNYIHTPSVVFRNVIKEFPPEFSLSPIGDYFLYLLLSEYGKLKYSEDEMAVYRAGVGIFSSQTDIKIQSMIIKQYACILSYLRNEKINNIILQRNFDIVNGNMMTFQKELSNNALAKKKSYFDLIKIIIKKITRYKINQ